VQFVEEIRSFLIKNKIAFSEKNPFEFSSKFPFIFLNDHQILLHCIALHHPNIKNISPDHFSKLCDAATVQNIRIINLWEDVWFHKKELVQSRILALCGISKRVHARQTKVVRIDKSEAEQFLNENHLQQNTNAYYKYGLYKNDALVAVATFSKSRVMTDSSALYRSYELLRFASLQGITVNGGLSKLLHFFIEQYHPAHLMTYADRDWSIGNSYKKMDFVFLENTIPQEFFIHPDEMIRLYPQRLAETESELLKKGYLKIYNAGNAKFILDRRNG
jgi:hypothetical protein